MAIENLINPGLGFPVRGVSDNPRARYLPVAESIHPISPSEIEGQGFVTERGNFRHAENAYLPDFTMRRRIGANEVRKKEKYWTNLFLTQAKQFCLATGLHGYKYIAQSQRSKAERIIWGIIVLASLACAVSLMTIAWKYNSERRTITVIETTHRGIWNYPFPAVTACNMNRVSLKGATKLVRQMKYPKHLSEDFLVSEMALLLELINPGVYDDDDVQKNLTRLQDIFDANGLSIKEVIEKVAQNCSELLLGCKWKGSWEDCRNIFEPSMAREGRCCSFNYIDSKDPNVPPKVLPRQLPSCGYQTGLTMYLNTDPDDYLATIMGSYGIKVSMHYPYDYPDYNAEVKLVGMGSQMFISVSPEEVYSTAGIRGLPIETRECVFSDEKKSKRDTATYNFTYALYTYSNCIAACRATVIRKMCNCVPYYLHQIGAKVCDLKDVQCLRNHSSWWETSAPGEKIDPAAYSKRERSQKDTHIRYKHPCGCLPDCTLYRYPVESSEGAIDRTVPYADLTFLPDRKLRNESVVHVFFSDLMSIQYRRSLHFNWLNMLASFGGLLGLFVGFSIMSGYELIYFFVIRVMGDAWMKRKKISSREISENDRFGEQHSKKQRF